MSTRCGRGKLTEGGLTDLEIVNLSLDILRDGPAKARNIANAIFDKTGKNVTPHRVGHVISKINHRFTKDKPDRSVNNQPWTYSLYPGWLDN